MTASSPANAQGKGQSWLILNNVFIPLNGSAYEVDDFNNLLTLEILVYYQPLVFSSSNVIQFNLPTGTVWNFTAGLVLTATQILYSDPVLGGPSFPAPIGFSYTYQATNIVLT